MNKKKKILVTGANGLLSSNMILELLEQGYCVKGFLRNKNKFLCGNHKNLELFEGDITIKEDLFKVLSNCDYVIHSAAITDQGLLKYSEYEKVNVNGTKNVIEAAIQNNVKKFVYISTANVFGFGSLNNLGDESKKMKHPYDKSNYAKSKLEGQNIVMSYSKKIEVIVVNPTFMIGAYGGKLSSGRIILMGLKNRIVLCPPGGKNFISVKDVSKGIINSFENGINGEAYLLANENLTYKEFFQQLRNNIEKNFIIIKIPKIMMLFLGLVGNTLRTLGLNSEFSLENMKSLCVNSFYTNNKAKNKLKISFQSIDNGIIEAIKWFNNNHENN